MRNPKAKSKKNSAAPGEAMSQEEFVALIKEAEKGPFYTHGKLVDKFNAWKKSLNNT